MLNLAQYPMTGQNVYILPKLHLHGIHASHAPDVVHWMSWCRFMWFHHFALLNGGRCVVPFSNHMKQFQPFWRCSRILLSVAASWAAIFKTGLAKQTLPKTTPQMWNRKTSLRTQNLKIGGNRALQKSWPMLLPQLCSQMIESKWAKHTCGQLLQSLIHGIMSHVVMLTCWWKEPC